MSTALLTYLLLARPRGYVRRDTLCLLFWPDADEEHARGALSQALSRVRRAAADDVFELRGKNEIRVSPGALECDVLSFEEALAGQRYDRAMELYAGPFLSGFHVPHAPGFEEWVERERERLRRLAVEAARCLAHRHIAANRQAEAARAAARALRLAPESEAVAEDLVRALAEAGDRGEALHLYDSWAERMARDLGLEPSDDLKALARELRTHAKSVDVQSSHSPSGLPQAGGVAVEEVTPVAPEASRPSPWRRRRRVFSIAAAGIVLLVVGWAIVQVGFLSAAFPVEARGRAATGLGEEDWLLVADVQAPSVDPGLALAFETLLVRDVESAGYTSVIGGIGAMGRRGLEDVLRRMRLPADTSIDIDLACEIAEREGAAGVLSSQVLPLGSDYVLAASVLGVPKCEELIQVSAVASFDELSAAVTGVSRELRARLGESRASIRSSPPLPPITASYTEAVREVARYISTAELWADEVRGAAPLEEALRIEPDFAFAHFLLALHYQRFGHFDLAIPHFQRAYELRFELPRQGRLGMEAIHQRYLESDPRAAMATMETVIADYPTISDATLPFLADLAAWLGDWQRSLDVSLEHLRERPGGLSGRLSRERAWRAAWALGRVELADSLFGAIQAEQRGAGLGPDSNAALLHRLRHRDWAGAEAYCADHPTWDRCGYLYLARGRFAKAVRTFGASLSNPGGGEQPLDRVAAVAALAYLDWMRGRPDEAWALLERYSGSMATAGGGRAAIHLGRFLLCGSAAAMSRSGELSACGIEGEDPREWDADPSFTVLLRSGAWSRRLLAVRSLERGDAKAALEEARNAVRSNFENPGLVDHLIHAMAFDALAQPDSALARYIEATRIERDCCFPTAAGVLFPLAPVYRRIGELSVQLGDGARARQYYGKFLELWEEADPQLQPQVEAVRVRMAGLAR